MSVLQTNGVAWQANGKQGLRELEGARPGSVDGTNRQPQEFIQFATACATAVL